MRKSDPFCSEDIRHLATKAKDAFTVDTQGNIRYIGPKGNLYALEDVVRTIRAEYPAAFTTITQTNVIMRKPFNLDKEAAAHILQGTIQIEGDTTFWSSPFGQCGMTTYDSKKQ